MRSKDKKIITLLIVAIVVAAFGGVALYMFLSPQKTTIYIFKENYKAGTIVSNEILTPITVDSKIVVAGGTQDAATQFITGDNRRELLDAKQNALRMDVAKGMPLTQSMLSVDGGSYIEMAMNDKKVAITIPINSISGVTRDLTEGARVNIYASSGKKGEGTMLIFENMRVLSVGKSDTGLTSATIEVTPEESIRLVDAVNNYTLYFGLVNGTGYETYLKPNSASLMQETETAIPEENASSTIESGDSEENTMINSATEANEPDVSTSLTPPPVEEEVTATSEEVVEPGETIEVTDSSEDINMILDEIAEQGDAADVEAE